MSEGDEDTRQTLPTVEEDAELHYELENSADFVSPEKTTRQIRVYSNSSASDSGDPAHEIVAFDDWMPTKRCEELSDLYFWVFVLKQSNYLSLSHTHTYIHTYTMCGIFVCVVVVSATCLVFVCVCVYMCVCLNCEPMDAYV